MKSFKTLMMGLMATTMLLSCKPKDSDVKIAVEKNLAEAQLSQVGVEVSEGVVTLSGEVKDDAQKILAATKTKDAKGVKSVNNNTTVEAPVVIENDDILSNNVRDAIKDYPTVVATVNDGVVSLTGEIKRDGLQKLMVALNALNPKKIDNKLIIN